MIFTTNMIITMMNLFCVLFCVLPFVSPSPLHGTPMNFKKCPFKVPPFLKQQRAGFYQERINFNSPTDHQGYAADSEKYPLMEWTCQQNRTWSYPFSPWKIYSLPDVVESIEFVLAFKLHFTTRIFTKPMQIIQEIGRRAGLDPFGEVPAMSVLSKEFSWFFESMVINKKIIIQKSAKVGAVRVKINKDAITLGSKLQKEIDEFKRTLNQTYFENPKFYDSFLSNYGSLWAEKAEFASLVWQVSIIEPTYLANHSWQHVEKNLHRSLVNYLGEWMEDDLKVDQTHHEPIDKEFLKINEVYICGQSNKYSSAPYAIFGFGCDRDLKDNGFVDWFPRAVRNPFIVEGKFKPIEDLFEDDVFIFENLKKARLTQMIRLLVNEKIPANLPAAVPELDDFYKIRMRNELYRNPSRQDENKYFEALQMNYTKVGQVDAKVQLRIVKEKLQKYESGIFNCKQHIVGLRFRKLPDVTEAMERLDNQLQKYKKEIDRLLELPDSEFVPHQAIQLMMEIDDFIFVESNTQVDFCPADNMCCKFELVTDLRYLFGRKDTYSDEDKQLMCMGEDSERALRIVSLWPFFKPNPIDPPNSDIC